MDNCVRGAQQLAIIANVIAVALTENLNASEQNVLGNLVVQIGSTILSIAATTELCENTKSDTSKTQNTSAEKTGQNGQTTSSDNSMQQSSRNTSSFDPSNNKHK
jgi:hypothetical protein